MAHNHTDVWHTDVSPSIKPADDLIPDENGFDSFPPSDETPDVSPGIKPADDQPRREDPDPLPPPLPTVG